MKQILQSLRTGSVEVANVPCPAVGAGQVLIRTNRTLISSGTERMLVDFGRKSMLGKARSQPDRVKQVLDKMRTDGVAATVESVLNKLDQPIALGYCNVGRVLEAGSDVSEFAVGDRVVSNGKHAAVVNVPRNLCVRIPDSVNDDAAAFAVIGAIALQGIRLAQVELGQAVVVTGLGLVGLVAVQLLRAHGCRVLGIDFDASRLALARQFGAEVVDLDAGDDPVATSHAFSRGRGVDAVLITASSQSSELMHQAAVMCRKRGRIVLVGVAGLELSRADFYEKELTFQVSCSYGPGRYDASYEDKGIDYPIGFVRWTAQRNLEAVLDMMSSGALDVAPLVSHRFTVADAADAYELISNDAESLGILLEFPGAVELPDPQLRQQTTHLSGAPHSGTTIAAPRVAFIGSGNYATAVLIPAFKSAGAHLRTVASQAGVSGVHAGRKFGFEATTTDTNSVFLDAGVDAIVVATRHDSHSRFAAAAAAAGKHVFVEKPLALDLSELDTIAQAFTGKDAPMLMVGFNRRFAPHVQRIKALLDGAAEPSVFVMTVNAGAIPVSHWTQDPAVGGGRIVGEGCHFIDLLRFLAGSPIVSFDAASIGRAAGMTVTDDKVSITLRFADGSLGTILYLANGHKSFPKERLEVFSGGRILRLDNFRRLTGFGWPRFHRMNLWRQDKGQRACAAAFVDAVRTGGPSPVPLNELIEVSRVAIEVAQSLR